MKSMHYYFPFYFFLLSILFLSLFFLLFFRFCIIMFGSLQVPQKVDSEVMLLNLVENNRFILSSMQASQIQSFIEVCMSEQM